MNNVDQKERDHNIWLYRMGFIDTLNVKLTGIAKHAFEWDKGVLDMVNIQPMSGPVGQIFTMKIMEKCKNDR